MFVQEIHFKEISDKGICAQNKCSYVLLQMQIWLKTTCLNLAFIIWIQENINDVPNIYQVCWKMREFVNNLTVSVV